MAALQAKAAGFAALYLSGAAMIASMGLPDLGIITVDEVAFFIRQVARASGLPVLVDGDTCQRALNRDPGFSPNRDPVVKGADGSARPGGAG
jgi:hypothetical protein